MSSFKTKILYVETFNQIGGGQVGLLDILTTIDKELYEPTVILPSTKGELYKRVSAIPNVSVEICNFNILPKFLRLRQYFPFTSPKGIKILTEAIKKVSPDIVHANHIFAAKYCCKAIKRAKLPLVVTLRNVYYDKKFNLSSPVDKLLYKNSSKVVFNSKTGAKIFNNRTQTDNVIAIQNGLILSKFFDVTNSEFDIYNQYNIPQGRKLIVMVATLTERKGQHLLVDALPTILQHNPEVHVIFVGEEFNGSGVKDQLISQISEKGVSDHVCFTGQVKDTSKINLAAHISILASTIGEGLPRTCIEALASGTPIVASNLAGVKEIVDDNENGFLITPGNSNELAQNVIKILSLSKEEYETMAQKNITKAKKKFDITVMLKQYYSVYNEVRN